MIEVTELAKSYGSVRAVDGISFSIPKGEVVGLLGPNGAGKTTTMKMLTCYMPPTKGRATVDGLDVVDDSLAVRRRIGYLPESVPLYDDMGVYEYLDFIGRVRGMGTGDRKDAIRTMVDRCGLTPVIWKGISQLSKGFRQRLGLAQALIHNPDLLILDEPTTGLDPNQIVEIRQLIRDLGKEKTVILSTHIMQEVEAVCDRVLIIGDGKIVADGTPDQLHTEFHGAQELDVLIAGGEKAQVEKALKAIGGVERVMATGARGKPVAAQVSSPKESDLREAVFKCCVANDWVLLEMSRRVVSLEEIFRALTRKDSP